MALATPYKNGEVLDFLNNTGSPLALNEIIPLGSRIAIARDAIAVDASGILALEGIWILPSVTNAAFAIGDPLYWDDSAKVITGISTAYFAGMAAAAKATTAALAYVELVDINPVAAGAVPAGSISNAELATDVKVGSLGALTTTAQTSVVAAINEINALKPTTPGTVDTSKLLQADANKDVTALRNLTLTGVIGTPSAQLTAGAATPAVAMRLGATATEGMEIKVYDEVISLTNAVTTNTTLAVPAGAVILSAQVNLQTAVVGDGSGDTLLARVGLGITGSVVKYGVTSALTKNLKIDTIPAHAVNAGETLALYAVKADGSTACTEKFVAAATVRVHVVYAVNNSLDNAA